MWTRPEDTEIAWQYLRRRRGATDPTYPEVLLNDTDVKVLAGPPYNIKVQTTVQRVGDAVWVPAGVFHQVKNLVSNVKVAVDIVPMWSLETVYLCHLVRRLEASTW